MSLTPESANRLGLGRLLNGASGDLDLSEGEASFCEPRLKGNGRAGKLSVEIAGNFTPPGSRIAVLLPLGATPVVLLAADDKAVRSDGGVPS